MRKVRSSVCLLLSLGLILSGCASTNQEPERPGGEVPARTTSASGSLHADRAVTYGFVPDELLGRWDESVTYAQFFDMLERVVSTVEPKQAAEFRAEITTVPDEAISRREAMLACLLAGQSLGWLNALYYEYCELTDQGDWHEVPSKFYADWDQPVQLDPSENGSFENMVIGGMFYCTRQISRITGTPLFTYDEDMKLRVENPLTVTEAAEAAVRLYESYAWTRRSVTEVFENQLRAMPELTAYFEEADARREAIRGSETAIQRSDTFIPGETYTGTAYYVSNSGSDANDGLSPETAWATIDKVNQARLAYGDAVFFERGSIWYGARIDTYEREGVTFSAYGQGEKPRFYGSDENGNGAEKWELYAETADGGKIWVYYRDMLDCASVVFNGGEAWTSRVAPFWNGRDFVCADDPGIVVDPVTWLDQDLTTFSDARSALAGRTPPLAALEDSEGGDFNRLENRGPLYVRCDAGNPGALYDDIQFVLPYYFMDTPDGCVADNLAVLYCGGGGIGGGQRVKHILIQNCEIGWAGGYVSYYMAEAGSPFEDGSFAFVPAGTHQVGGACALNGEDSVCRNNYIHHVFDESLAIEIGAHDTDTAAVNILHEGNLVEYSGQPLLLCNWDEEINPDRYFQNCVYRDNYILFTGMETFGDKYRAVPLGAASLTSQGGPNMHNGGLEASDNVFLASAGKLVLIEIFDERYAKIYRGNTYIQLEDHTWAQIEYGGDQSYQLYYGSRQAQAAIDAIGDTEAVIIPIG